MRGFDFNDPFFRPLWIRLAVVGFTLGWALFEFLTGAPFWGILFGAAGLWAFHGLFIAFDPREGGK
jgi:hypothetical protein